MRRKTNSIHTNCEAGSENSLLKARVVGLDRGKTAPDINRQMATESQPH